MNNTRRKQLRVCIDDARKIIDAVNDANTKSINNLCNYIVNGKRIIGKTNIERLFVFLTNYKDSKIL